MVERLVANEQTWVRFPSPALDPYFFKFVNALFIFFTLLASLCTVTCAKETPSVASSSLTASAPSVLASVPSVASSPVPVSSERPIRAIHLTAWVAGSKKQRAQIEDLIAKTDINAVVIAIKEFEGEVYIPGFPAVEKAKAYTAAMPDIAEWVKQLKEKNIYTIARIVVFKDNIMPRRDHSLGVHNKQGELWFDRHRNTWLDPYNPGAWRYNLLIALQASKLGFDEVQFDYIRFPTDGVLSQMKFAKPYSREEASQALVDFLKQARQLLAPLGTKISIDVFGLTTSVSTGMGIGQQMGPMAREVDYVCPMVYPSHYAKGEYGIANPNSEPYKIIHYAVRDAIKMLGSDAYKLRPYLQDFSLGVRYGQKEVRAQLQASADLGVYSWSLWNARSRYTEGALKDVPKPQATSDFSSSTTIQRQISEPAH